MDPKDYPTELQIDYLIALENQGYVTHPVSTFDEADAEIKRLKALVAEPATPAQKVKIAEIEAEYRHLDILRPVRAGKATQLIDIFLNYVAPRGMRGW